MIVVPLVTWTFVAITPPICTVAPVKKLLPEIVVVLPPSVGPEAGLSERTDGPLAVISTSDATDGTPFALRINNMYCPGGASVGPEGAVTVSPPEACVKLS